MCFMSDDRVRSHVEASVVCLLPYNNENTHRLSTNIFRFVSKYKSSILKWHFIYIKIHKK